MFVLIENNGEAFLESFTMLGVSTSRDTDKIGQFGSGAKMGILQLLRNGTPPIIYSGTTKIEFFAKPAQMGTKLYNKVMVKIGGKERELGFALEYGEMDWTTPWMALREFVSNAIDASSFEDVTIGLKDTPRAKAGTTRIFIPADPSIVEAFNLLQERFLHFSYQQNNFTIKKDKVSPCKVYRRGVFVRELREHSMFNYNLDIPVDECRNCEDWTAKYYIQRNLDKLSVEEWDRILSYDNIITDKLIESTADYTFPKLAEAYLLKYGDVPACDPLMFSVVQYKSARWTVLPKPMVDSLEKSGIKTASSFISKLEQNGNTIKEATPLMRKLYDECRQFLFDLGYVFPEPKLMGFQSTQNNSAVTMGYVENDTIYINVDNETSRSTMLEELVHHMTGASDCTRDFQATLCDICARAMEYFV